VKSRFAFKGSLRCLWTREQRVYTQPRILRLEALEARMVLSSPGGVTLDSSLANDSSRVPFWDGERQDFPDHTLNYFGGNPVAGDAATIEHTTDVVRSGNGAYRISTNGTIPTGWYDFVGTALTGFFESADNPSAKYIDTRDVSRYEQTEFWIRNETGSPFTLKFEVKDFRDSNDHRAWRTYLVSGNNEWMKIVAPLDLGNGWVVEGEPDLSRTKLFSFVIEAHQGAPVNGSVYLDDMILVERGGPIDPQNAPVNTLVEQLARRQFNSLWGARDRDTGLLPTISAYANVMALNTTSALVKVLPTAISQSWVSLAEANDYVETVVDTLNLLLDQAHYLPPRYVDRATLEVNYLKEESVVDAAFSYLALYQYKSLPGTPASLQVEVDQLLSRFDFAAFGSPRGWKMAYQYDKDDLTPGTYDGYSGEVWVISLAAHLANQVDMYLSILKTALSRDCRIA